MNIETGEIRDLLENENPKKGEVYISQLEKKYLEMVMPDERPELLHNLRSKNNTAKRRARKKIADASRRRNR